MCGNGRIDQSEAVSVWKDFEAVSVRVGRLVEGGRKRDGEMGKKDGVRGYGKQELG